MHQKELPKKHRLVEMIAVSDYGSIGMKGMEGDS